MGQRLVACADAYDDLMVAATFDRNTSTGSIAECEVLIDFSLPDTGPIVTCHMGWTALVTVSPAEIVRRPLRLRRLPNSSDLLGDELRCQGLSVAHLVGKAVQMLGPPTTEVFEIHHGEEDASGTALLLAETACRSAGYSWPEAKKIGRDTGPRGECEVGTAALRGRQVAGEHTVFLFGAADRLELIERRIRCFRSWCFAAKWLSGQQKGLRMHHLMGLFSPDKRPE